MSELNINLDELNSLPTGHVGHVALLGRPNTGKSTLMNTVLDFHLAAVSAKPQTTQRHWKGIYSDDTSQIIFLDAPGVHESHDELDEAMARSIAEVLESADLILCLADATRPPGAEDMMVAQTASKSSKQVLVAINKIDRAKKNEVADMVEFYSTHLPDAKFFHISALKSQKLSPLLDAIRQALPVGAFYYHPDTVTDAYERHIACDLIRETLLELLRDEVPHATAVVIEKWSDGEKKITIHAALNVEREQQKGIIVGQEGVMINKVRQASVKKLRELCGKRVNLKLWVKVSPKWRRKKGKLKEFELID